MRVLHTADWHLGHVLHGHDRSADHRIALSSLAGHVAEYQPDVLVVSGDIFHTSQPSAAAMQLLSEALIELREKAPNMHIVLTAGNHDSPTRHEVFRLPWQALNVTVVGRPPVDDVDIERFIIPIDGKGYIVAIPYMHPRHVPEGFFERIYGIIKHVNVENLPVIAMAHAAITGCDATGHDDWDADVIGSLTTMSASEFGSGYDYLALGHIHHAQTLSDNNPAVRYAGSLCPVSFAENYSHSVTLVDIERHGDNPGLKNLLIETGRNLVTFGSKNGMNVKVVTEAIAEMIKELQPNDFLRINLALNTTEKLPATLNAIVVQHCNEHKINFCGFNIVRQSTVKAASAAALSRDELKQLNPVELLKIYAAQKGEEIDDQMTNLFKEIADKEAKNEN